jgi:hypothetical protein
MRRGNSAMGFNDDTEIKKIAPKTEVTKTNDLVLDIDLTGCKVARKGPTRDATVEWFRKIAIVHGKKPNHSHLLVSKRSVSRVPSYQEHTIGGETKNG